MKQPGRKRVHPAGVQQGTGRRVRTLRGLGRLILGIDPDHHTIQQLFRQFTGFTALVTILWNGHREGITSSSVGAALALTFILLLVRINPVAWTRERPLNLTSPVVFAGLIWLGSFPTALGVWMACLLHSQVGHNSLAGRSRGYIRFQGSALACVVALTRPLTDHVALHFGVPSAHGLMLHAQSGTDQAMPLLAAAAFNALLFTFFDMLFTISGDLALVRDLLRSRLRRRRFGSQAQVYALGMLPVVLLSPFGAVWGFWLVAPLGIMLLQGAISARLTLELHGLRSQLQIVEEMGRASTTRSPHSADPEALMRQFLVLAQGLVESEMAIVWTMNQESLELTPTASLPNAGVFTGQKISWGEGLIGNAVGRSRPQRIADSSRQRGSREIAYGAWLLYPLIVHERRLGVAHWIRPTNHPFTQEDVARLDALVPQAAVALENLRVREVMLNLASTDGLTELWNHRRMHELLREEIRRAIRYHRALSVMMMDVDSFKTFNDTYGHPCGDQLLRTIASILRANVRTVDHVGRYGGEEFLIILPETSKDAACRMAERIRVAIEEQAYVIVAGKEIRRTVSIGVASCPEDALNAGALMQQADDALYRAKRAGKNRVLWA